MASFPSARPLSLSRGGVGGHSRFMKIGAHMADKADQPVIEQSGTVSRGVLKLIVLQAITCMPDESYPAFAEIVLAALGMSMSGARASGPAERSPDAPSSPPATVPQPKRESETAQPAS